MSIEQDVVTLLSPLVSGRVYPDVSPEDIRAPHIVYSVIYGAGLDHLEGDPGLKNLRLQFDCWATTKAAAVGLMDSVLAAFRASSLSNNLIGRNPSGYDAPTKLHSESLDISVWQ